MGEVIDAVTQFKAREYARLWNDALNDKPGSVERLRDMVAVDPEFKAFCEIMYRVQVAKRAEAYAFDDGA